MCERIFRKLLLLQVLLPQIAVVLLMTVPRNRVTWKSSKKAWHNKEALVVKRYTTASTLDLLFCKDLLLMVAKSEKQPEFGCIKPWWIMRYLPYQHQLIGSLSHSLQGFIHPRWCRISEPSTVFHGISQEKFSGGTPWPRTADDAPHASKLLRGSKVAIYSDLFPPGTVTPNGGGLEGNPTQNGGNIQDGISSKCKKIEKP